jgi:hypothetical protein
VASLCGATVDHPDSNALRGRKAGDIHMAGSVAGAWRLFIINGGHRGSLN